MTALRIVVEGLVHGEAIVIDDLEVPRAPFEGETVRLVDLDEEHEVDGRFVVDRVAWGTQGDATAFLRPEA